MTGAIQTEHEFARPIRSAARRVLFCRSGGGMRGLDIHCGIWLALADAGIHSAANSGTSAGAIISALDSRGWTPAACRGLLLNLRDRHVRRDRFLWQLRIRWISHFLDPSRISGLLAAHVPWRFDMLIKPLTVWATNEPSGAQRGINSGDLRAAVLASMSIAGVFPPVRIGAEWFSDGGPTNYLGLAADWETFDDIYFLIASPPRQYPVERGGILTRLMRNIAWLIEDQIGETLHSVHRRAHAGQRIFVLRPHVANTGGSLRFNHKLIDQAFSATRTQLEALRCANNNSTNSELK
ncbi:MAG: patatin-like phospholipase family protein [Kiritimatiellae bacterium]|nr:patatin-like phospholipase family protein [Kiritimatiellia bacterium]